jgi:hypothetical protein
MTGISLSLALALAPARAQVPAEPMVREAFATPYGEALTAELGKNLRAAADGSCLNAKAIAPDELKSRGRDLVIKWGAHMLDAINAIVDRQVYQDKFKASAELAALKKDAAVMRYLALQRPIALANVLDSVFEQFDRYLLIVRFKVRPVSPLGSGNEELLRQNPAETSEDELEKYVATTRSLSLQRFLDLSDAAAASSAAIKKDQVPLTAALSFLKGIEADLAELCIRPR